MAKITRADAVKLLANVPEQYVFRNNDGRIFRNVRELSQALASMADETFTYHCTAVKKDFSNWVRDIIGDQELATDLQKCQGRVQAAKIVAKRVAFLESKAR